VLAGCENLQLFTAKTQVKAVDLKALHNEVSDFVESIELEVKRNDKLSLVKAARNHLQQVQDYILMIECLQSKHLRPIDW